MILITTAKSQLKKQVDARLYTRTSCMERIINERIPSTCRRFVIDETNNKLICDNIFNKIDQYNGKKKLQNRQQDTQKNVIEHARKWWNRQKPLPFGSFLFSEIMFYQLPQFIQRECSSLTPLEQIILFIDIFQAFIAHKIKFDKTKPKPLILQA
eukprot:426573_1